MRYIYKSPRALLLWQDEIKGFHISSSDSNAPAAEIWVKLIYLSVLDHSKIHDWRNHTFCENAE